MNHADTQMLKYSKNLLSNGSPVKSETGTEKERRERILTAFKLSRQEKEAFRAEVHRSENPPSPSNIVKRETSLPRAEEFIRNEHTMAQVDTVVEEKLLLVEDEHHTMVQADTVMVEPSLSVGTQPLNVDLAAYYKENEHEDKVVLAVELTTDTETVMREAPHQQPTSNSTIRSSEDIQLEEDYASSPAQEILDDTEMARDIASSTPSVLKSRNSFPSGDSPIEYYPASITELVKKKPNGTAKSIREYHVRHGVQKPRKVTKTAFRISEPEELLQDLTNVQSSKNVTGTDLTLPDITASATKDFFSEMSELLKNTPGVDFAKRNTQLKHLQERSRSYRHGRLKQKNGMWIPEGMNTGKAR